MSNRFGPPIGGRCCVVQARCSADISWPRGSVRPLALLAEAVAADPAVAAALLEQAMGDGTVIALPAPGEAAALAGALASEAPPGPAVVVGSGGSAGGRRWVQLGVAGLEAAADGLGQWLLEQGLDPATCLWLDPLPLHHVSGLMPWLRARRLGGRLRWLAPALLRDPAALAAACPLPADQPALLKTRQRLHHAAAKTLWRTLLQQGWRPVEPQWGEDVDP